MKLIILILALLFSFICSAYPEETASRFRLNISITGTKNYEDYKYIVQGIKVINGVQNLVAVRQSPVSIELAGGYNSDPATLETDIQGLVVDRFSMSKKSGGDAINIILKKLP